MTATAAAPQGYQAPEPNPIQQLLLDAPASDFLHLGTGKGVGKSFGVLFRVARDHRQYGSNFHTLIVRATFQSLQEIQSILFTHLTQWFPGTTYSASDNIFRLGGKAAPFGTIELAYSATTPTEALRASARLQGRSKQLLIFDECGNMASRDFIDTLMGVLRGEPGQPTAAIFLSNPGGSGHHWLKQTFAIPAAAASGGPAEHMRPQRFWSEEFKRFVIHCTANASINKHLDWQQYRRQVELMAGGDENLLQALLNGSWEIEAGGAFFAPPVWSTRRCRKVIERGSIDLVQEKCFLAFDWGVGAPSAMALIWPNPPETPPGTLWMIDEMYVCERGIDGSRRNFSKGVYLSNLEQAAAIAEWLYDGWGVMPGQIPAIADDAIFASTGSAKGSVAAEFRAAGVNFRPAQKMKHRLAEGLSMVRSMMASTGRDGQNPWLMWSQHCAAWEATVPGLAKHPRDPNVCADGQPDHILDAVRMAVMWHRGRYKVGTKSGAHPLMWR